MTATRLSKAGVLVAWASIVVTLGVWLWMLTRPAGTFHDQGGLFILLFYFPLTFVIWLGCTVTTSILIHYARKLPTPDVTAMRKGRWMILWLRIAGLLLSLATLFIA